MLSLSDFYVAAVAATLGEGWIRNAKTSLVKTLAPKPIRDAVAGAGLAGRAKYVASKGYPKVADRMQRKAARWASGDRKEPDPDGQWNGNNSKRKPVT